MKKAIVGNTVVYSFTDLPDYIFDCALLSEVIKAQCVPFAMSHRLGDKAALSCKDGLVVTEAMRREAVAELGDFYAQGGDEWNMRQVVRKAPQNAAILKFAAATGRTYEETEIWLQEQALKEITSL